MKLIINGHEAEYNSDYPTGWKFSAGDPFKFPVTINNQDCFIKRFVAKSPGDTSGWQLLQKLKGKTEPNLPRVFDIKEVTENEENVSYVFYEYIPGKTLEKQISVRETVDLKRLTSDIFHALGVIHQHGFWFADFCEKNIFCEHSGRFLLVDLDSAQPLTDAPSNDMYGSKDYWIPVYQFYKEVLHQPGIRLSDINGIGLDYLQFIFLILYLTLFIESSRHNYRSDQDYKQLPLYLNKLDSGFGILFNRLLTDGSDSISPEQISSIKKLIELKIINTTNPNSGESKIAIYEFSSSNTTAKQGEPFTIIWKTDADKTELYRNGALLQTVNAAEQSVERTEFHDSDKDVTYDLIAYKGDAQLRSEPLIIKIADKKKKSNFLKAGAIILGIFILAAVGFLLINKRQANKEFSVKEDQLYEDSVITIYCKEKLDVNATHVFFDGIEATEKTYNNNSLTVHVPALNDKSSLNFISTPLSVKVAGKEVYSTELTYQKKVIIDTFTSRITQEDATLTFTGKNLNVEFLKILFNNSTVQVLASSYENLTVRVPELENITTTSNINVEANYQGSFIFKKTFKILYDSIDLINKASTARWSGGILSSDGNSMISRVDLPIPNNESNQNGFAIPDEMCLMENGSFNKVLRTHPMWQSNGTIKGFYDWVTLRGKKKFTAQLGFKKNGQSSDGVTFQVWVHYLDNSGVERWVNIVSKHKSYDGSLINLSVDFPPNIPDRFYLELRVDAGNESISDWAAWVDPKVIAIQGFYSGL